MDIAQFWNMLPVSRSKVTWIAIVFLWLPSESYSQLNRQNYNYLEYKNKDYYFGISLGANSSKFHVFHSREFVNSDTYLRAQGIAHSGFNVHGIANYKFGEYFDFRVLPGFTFSNRSLEFDQGAGLNDQINTESRNIESIFVELPFHIRYKSAPYRDKRAYVIVGLNYTFDVASNSKTRQADSLIKINPHDFQLEAGVGMQFFFPYFILSPEIKVSQGINNILLYNNQLEESTIIEKLLSRVLTISFHFEG